MSITAKQSADGLVHLNCPNSNCGIELHIRPKRAKTWATCTGCGEKFSLEVTNMPPAVPPPVPGGPAAAPPPPILKRPKQPWDIDEDDRQEESRLVRRQRETRSAVPVGLIVAGVVAALLVVGGITIGVVYATREKSVPDKPQASAPGSERTAIASQSIPPIEIARPAVSTSSQQSTPSAPKKPSEPTAGNEPKDKTPESDSGKPIEPKQPIPGMDDVPAKTKTPPKGKDPASRPDRTSGPLDKDAIDRVKRSTALIEAKGGWGTGFVIRPGIVMTNAHVIAGQLMDDFRVSFVSLNDTAPPGLKPTLLYTDPRRDLAILRVDTDRPPLDPVETGTELSGLDVAIVGNPKGAAGQAEINKVTTGKLSAPIRRDAGWTYYELSAQAYFGNSGGPVVDRNSGKLVGVIQSILGDGKQRSYCIPYGEALRALESLPKKEEESKATKVALGRHYLDYINQHLPALEGDAENAMEGQLARLRAKAAGVGVNVTVRNNAGQLTTMSLAEFMTLMKERHQTIYPNFNKIMPMINGSAEIPSSLKQLMRERIETYFAMYSLASATTNTEKAFKEAMDSRKSANVKKGLAFKDAYGKFLDELERSPVNKAK